MSSGKTLTAEMLADALGCFWNAAIGDARDKQDSRVLAVASSMAEGFAAVERRLREHAQPAPTSAVDGEETPIDIVKAARVAADMVGVTPYSDMRLHVEHAVRYALLADRAMAQAVPTSAALAKDTSRFRKLSNFDDDTAPTSAVDGEIVQALRGALEWYAEQVGHVRKNHKEGDVARAALSADCGKRAEDALSAQAVPAPMGGAGEMVGALREALLYSRERLQGNPTQVADALAKIGAALALAGNPSLPSGGEKSS
ncbi:hypothetical protein NKH48_13710 [Mesorhizobium sp. M1233]|uniref:hypothetical protein n=1 Tax=Mesorhizobium sp. M1233 TaxID=2957072 RepID=UPI0033386168